MTAQQPIRFGTDGIRGVAGQHPLSPAATLSIGRAIGGWLRQQGGTPTAIIGRDTRPSGPQIAASLLAGLAAEGVTADDAGVLTTPGVAHIARAGHYQIGIVISASHNPAAQNGIKLIGGDGFKLSDDDQTAIETAIDHALRDSRPASSFGQIRPADQHRARYVEHLTAVYAADALAGLSVVLDCANGAAFEIAPQAFARLGADVTALGTSPTGANINVRSGSEYVRRHRETLLNMMQTHDAQLGIAFDGDADRVIFLTRGGKLVDGDHILGVLATAMQARGELPGATVVATTMSNSGLKHYLNERGIALEQTKVGDRYVMERMRAGGFALGGEQAGHIILLDDDHTAGDGVHVGLLVAALVAQEHDLLERAVADIPKFPQVIASAHLAAQVPLDDVARLQPLIDETLAAFDHQGRVNVRYSGTEPSLLRVMVEGGLKSTQQEVVQRALAICNLVAASGQQDVPRIDVVDTATGARIEL